MEMALSKDERIEIILRVGSGSSRIVAAEYNGHHPDRRPITHDTVTKLVAKFKKNGSVDDQRRSGRPRTAGTEECATMVLSALSKSPRKSSGRLSAETGISQSSIARIVKEQKWHPYKLQMRQHLSEDNRTVAFNSVNGSRITYLYSRQFDLGNITEVKTEIRSNLRTHQQGTYRHGHD
jgi:transposase